jgi:hypothetical protein
VSDWLPPRMSNDSNPADGAALDVLDHLGEGVAPLDIQTAFAFVGVLCVDLPPRRFAYSRMTSTWLLVEYCWCSVDMRTQAAAGIGSRGCFAWRHGRMGRTDVMPGASPEGCVVQ